MKIVLFEDDPVTGPRLLSEIKQRLARSSQVELFEASMGSIRGVTLYEERLAREVGLERYRGATMWVTDRDLSRIARYEGLSEAVISKVAFRFGVPLCKYARGATGDDVLKRQRSWGDAQIVLESRNLDELGEKIAIIAKGFEHISRELRKIMPGKKVIGGIHTPADVMARVLARPALADQIAMYGSGDQSMVVEILPFANSLAHVDELKARLPSLLGYWLYDSLLRFPGILVNATSAASYLDIAVNQFADADIRELFVSALYKGPFADNNDPRWWRGDLDDILRKAKATTGRELVDLKLKRRVRGCVDSETRKRAGWYCMVRRCP